jgi:hypothetical protein
MVTATHEASHGCSQLVALVAVGDILEVAVDNYSGRQFDFGRLRGGGCCGEDKAQKMAHLLYPNRARPRDARGCHTSESGSISRSSLSERPDHERRVAWLPVAFSILNKGLARGNLTLAVPTSR